MASLLNIRPSANSKSSLPSLPAHLQSDTHLTAHLASRFHLGQCTATLSSSALISLNNYTSSAKGPDGDKAGSAMGEAEEMAGRIWARMGARAENQAVVFLGESGAGKTTIRSHLLSALLSHSSTPLSTKLSLAAFVFDTLTTTKTVTTPTASKAGLYYELQYDTTSSVNPTLIGGKLLDHRLERSRVASVPTGERNFHVLYYLLSGTSAAEKTHLGLDAAHAPAADRTSSSAGHKRWRYLGHPTQLKVGINDAEGFQHFKTALRKLEFPRSEIAEICQILAGILHLGQLEFSTSQSTTPAGDESGGFSHEGGESVTVVRNKEVLTVVAAFLGVAAADLETSLGYKTKTLHRERVTVMLDPHGARDNADELARTLYALLVAYVIENINQRLCAAEHSVANTIAIIDFPGFAQVSATGSTLDQLLNNAATEAVHHFCLQSYFERRAEMLDREEVRVPATSYFDNSDAIRGLLKPGNGLLSILDDQTRRGRTDLQFLESIRKRFAQRNPAITVGSATTVLPGSNFASQSAAAAFTVKHFAGEVEYPVQGLVEENGEVISGDLMKLVRSTHSDFVRELFGQEALKTTPHPQETSTILQAQVSSKPSRMPSVLRRGSDGLVARFGPNRKERTTVTSSGLEEAPAFGSEDGEERALPEISEHQRRRAATTEGEQGAAAQYLASLDTITQSLALSNTNASFVFCLKPNDRRIANQFDSKCVRTQMQTFGIAEISQRLRNADLSLFLPFGEFLALAEADSLIVGTEREKAETVVAEKGWPSNEGRVGSTGVFLSDRVWAELARIGRTGSPGARSLGRSSHEGEGEFTPSGLNDSKVRLIEPSRSPGAGAGAFIYGDDAKHGGGYFGSKDETRSEAGASAIQQGDMFRNLETRAQMAEKGNERLMEEVDDVVSSRSRKRWLALVWLLTFYIPDFAIRLVGRMKRKDIRTAWREKLAINLLIWLSCGFVIFFIVIFPQLICPKQHVFSSAELAAFDGKGTTPGYTAIRGEVFDLSAFLPSHYPAIVPTKDLLRYAGVDATKLFPIQISALCDGKDAERKIDPALTMGYTPYNASAVPGSNANVDSNARFHDFRYLHRKEVSGYRRDWYWEKMLDLRAGYRKGHVGYTPQYVRTLAGKQNTIAILHGRVYDLTAYVNQEMTVVSPPGEIASDKLDKQFLSTLAVDVFQQRSGQDISAYWEVSPMAPDLKSRMQICLDNMFMVGHVDTRNSARCQFARYILLAISIVLVSVIGFKFFAALQFGQANVPEKLDKFVICQVPAYTEDEESLRRAIDSAARMKYDDKRKLLVIICDGMIIGQGNDRPTPRIVLDILGVSDTVDPEPLSFESLGEGMKQHNMGKVYSGLYETGGHIVPFLVVVKVGKPSEVSRPGNRGKRDSQMVIMRFLHRVHYNHAMSPMELEMHHQIRNIIGVNPTFYEFMLQIDADTVVAPDAATRMVAAFLHDTRLIGVCGETALTNAKASFTTMIQVYEYYISHNLSKAFESLFGSVTCLPGCFSMYRIRAAETGKPLFVSTEVIAAYATVRVDTLHMKNLLYLGEDRYLTTLLLKYHAKYKTKFLFSARAWTIAPDSWAVFLSQRRRWINSTVHNLMELIPLQQLCGFCCFSMRFVVFLDLLSTVVQPVTVAYIVYLIVLIVQHSSVIPLTAFILLGAVYGLQAIIFILRRKWEMIGWMIIYILAIPVFSFGLPLYAFWHMDDFSWGNTRVVTGEKGGQVVISDEGRFDPASIPRKKWEDYQAELWEAQTHRDDQSELSGISYGTRSYHAGGGIPSGGNNAAFTTTDQGYAQHTRPMSQHHQHSQLDLTRFGGSRMSLGGSASELGLGGGGGGGARAISPNAIVPTEGGLEMAELAELLPSDDAILAEIREILKTADLMTVTKKAVKAELEARFACGLDAKRAYINSATEALLSGQL